jgi:hypothetical protein
MNLSRIGFLSEKVMPVFVALSPAAAISSARDSMAEATDKKGVTEFDRPSG